MALFTLKEGVKKEKDSTHTYVGMRLENGDANVLAQLVGLDPATCTGTEIFKQLAVYVIQHEKPELLQKPAEESK